MRKPLIFLISILAVMFLANHAQAGIIIRPVLNTGLVGYWDFQEGAGNATHDKSGFGNHGILRDNPTWKDGKIGGALEFDGSVSYVEISHTSDLNFGTSNFTISAWINRPDTSIKVICGKRVYPPGYVIYLDGNNLAMQLNDATPRAFTLGTYSDLNNWHHVTVVVNRVTGLAVYYLDGIPQAPVDISATTGSIDNEGWFGIGRDYSDPAVVFNGTIDEVRIYNRALSESEISRLYKMSSPKIGVNKLGLVDPQLPANATISYVREDCSGYSPCYNTLSAWETAFGGFGWDGCTPGDLTCLNKTAVAKIDGTWNSPDTTIVSIDGWTTDATRYIKIYTTASARHPGKWDETKYRLTGTNTYVVDQFEDYVVIDGLQMKLTVTSGYVYRVILRRGISGVFTLSNNIIVGAISGADGIGRGFDSEGGTGADKIYNNIIYGFINGSVADNEGLSMESTNAYIYNNTIYNCYTGIKKAWGTTIAKNNIVYNNTDNYSGTFDDASTNNLSGPTQTDAPGSNPKNAIKVNFADVTNYDFHLAPSDTGARDVGANLSNDANISFSIDIDRQNRAGNWDIGADEGLVTKINVSQTNQLTDGLVGFWSFNGPDIDGNEAYDRSGNNNHGVISGATKTIGKVGQALSFDGSSNYVKVTDPGSSVLDITSSLTLSVWVYPNTLSDGYNSFLAKGSSVLHYYVDVNGTTDKIWFRGRATCPSAIVSNGTILEKEWTHIVGVFDDDADTQTIYINGAQSGSNGCATSLQKNNDALRIGDFYGSEFFDGKIDEVRIYNRVLSAEEIRRLYNLGR